MALFEVPGWSLNDTPISQISHNSKKRKRPSGSDDAETSSATSSSKLHSAVQNMEKLVASLGAAEDGTSKPRKNKNKKQGRADERKPRKESVNNSPSTRKQKVAGDIEKGPAVKGKKVRNASEGRESKANAPAKKQKKEQSHDGQRTSEKKTQPFVTSAPPASAIAINRKGKNQEEGLTALQANMKQSLDGARFRCVAYSLVHL